MTPLASLFHPWWVQTLSNPPDCFKCSRFSVIQTWFMELSQLCDTSTCHTVSALLRVNLKFLFTLNEANLNQNAVEFEIVALV